MRHGKKKEKKGKKKYTSELASCRDFDAQKVWTNQISTGATDYAIMRKQDRSYFVLVA